MTALREGGKVPHPALAGITTSPEIARVVSDPDFAAFSVASQDRILTKLFGDGVGWWWSRRVRRLGTRQSEPVQPLNRTDIAAIIAGLGR